MKTRPTVEEVVKIVGECVVGEKVVDLLPAVPICPKLPAMVAAAVFESGDGP